MHALELLCCFGLSAMMSHAALSAVSCTKESPPHKVALVELYTSEGCDSCPPADAWLREAAKDTQVRDRAVFLALHVDYWDNLGWKDIYALPGAALRQRALAAMQSRRLVYTPEIFVDLVEWRGWRAKSAWRSRLDEINRAEPRGKISLALAPYPASISIEGTLALLGDRRGRDVDAYFAVYERHVASQVTSGENRGAKLQHDFVVRQWIGPLHFAGRDALNVRQLAPLDPAWAVANLGVAAFMHDVSKNEIVQATSLDFCGPLIESLRKSRAVATMTAHTRAGPLVAAGSTMDVDRRSQ